MKKTVILAVLLAPSFCLAKTKQEIQERQNAIVAEAQQIESNLKYMEDAIKYNFWVLYLNPDYFRNYALEAKKKIVELNKEYYQLEEEKHA